MDYVTGGRVLTQRGWLGGSYFKTWLGFLHQRHASHPLSVGESWRDQQDWCRSGGGGPGAISPRYFFLSSRLSKDSSDRWHKSCMMKSFSVTLGSDRNG